MLPVAAGGLSQLGQRDTMTSHQFAGHHGVPEAGVGGGAGGVEGGNGGGQLQ